MNMIIGLVIVLAIVVLLGGGGFLLFYLKSRPKKETWKAEIYQLADGDKQVTIRNGKVKERINLADLRPYGQDSIEKVEIDTGITLYRLKRLNKKVPPVQSSVVEYWGKDDRRVKVLYHKGAFTLMKSGYDSESSTTVFDPLSHDRIDLIKGEIAMRKDRLRNEKNVLEAISPWIVAGILMVGIIAVAYISGNSFVATSKNYQEGSAKISEELKAWRDAGIIGRGAKSVTPPDVGRQEPDPPPSIE